MRPAFFDSPEYQRKQGEIVHLNWQKGMYNFLIKRSCKKCLNRFCKSSFIVPPSDKQKYCSQNCWYLVRKQYRIKTSPPCLNCRKLVTQKGASKFCSISCQFRHQHNIYISKWKQGLKDGNAGINVHSLSRHIRFYLFEKFNRKCSRCGWNKTHPTTLVVPLEVNHIDGNSENNKEENLELLCPNCHALTPNFRNLNKGKGRNWRIKYLKTLI